MKSTQGFTLAELLIALAILGVIATFTIPKILDSSASSEDQAKFQEMISTLSGAYMDYKRGTGSVAGTTAGDFLANINYASQDVTTTTAFVTSCATEPCYVMHNGSGFQFNEANTFGGVTAADALIFEYSSDVASGVAADRTTIVLYYNGRVTTRGALAGDATTGGTALAQIATDGTYVPW